MKISKIMLKSISDVKSGKCMIAYSNEKFCNDRL